MRYFVYQIYLELIDTFKFNTFKRGVTFRSDVLKWSKRAARTEQRRFFILEGIIAYNEHPIWLLNGWTTLVEVVDFAAFKWDRGRVASIRISRYLNIRAPCRAYPMLLHSSIDKWISVNVYRVTWTSFVGHLDIPHVIHELLDSSSLLPLLTHYFPHCHRRRSIAL